MLKYFISLQWRKAAEVEAENEKRLQEAIAQSMKTAPQQAEAEGAGDASAAESEKEKEKEQEKAEQQAEEARPKVQAKPKEEVKEPEAKTEGILKMFGGWRTKLVEQTTAPFKMDETVKEEVKPKLPEPAQRVTVVDDLKSEQTYL